MLEGHPADDEAAIDPALLEKLFDARRPLIREYARLLAGSAVARGLIGPAEIPRLWERHLLNCAALSAVVPTSVTVADVGSGAGLPGIPLALARPDLTITLVESMARRVAFLEEVRAALHLERVNVLRARSEEVEDPFDVVVTRAVARLPTLVKLVAHLLPPGGLLLALKGERASEEIEDARAVLRRFRCSTEVDLLSIEWTSDDLLVRKVNRRRGERATEPERHQAAGFEAAGVTLATVVRIVKDQ
ncbi:MAG: 16S rRNA (guanine(527)-N(7))-methyltransferase RsmG [Acidothermus sp.]|nr:16S rRNA (guanine(527)-N(7))-methyltransferase RsmG [Acidothermus sp.]